MSFPTSSRKRGSGIQKNQCWIPAGVYAAIEKILVDLYVEAENLNLMDRDECQRMQKNAIESGRVEVATMIRYAKRRKLAPADAFPWIGSITGTY
ncbi:MAG: DUF6577 family protein [Verrucomicrobiota bacterium]